MHESVQGAVADTLASDPKCKIIKRDDLKKLVEFSHEPYTLTIQVDPMAAGISQITVLAENQGKPTQNTSDKAAKQFLLQLFTHLP